ncbi:M23 family peptidase [Phenylobacterium hankyongense]|uniref:M23 family peptidase n=1 Tax=Phenylobacterium hankyongense TaxID=1813876 RepID=A0A328AVM2_9CAUL|nr:M23 family metallopeptidase [Phenylobacterium hankyongense]RAK59043.1 M23 family peptidase [Phenylobacterium hankyongense]
MAEPSLARESRARHWLVDAAVGGGLALGLITAAHAALPKTSQIANPPRARLAAAPAPQAPVAPPPVLIAFQSPLPGYEVDSPFGLRQLPWEEHGRLHAGVDIAAPTGQPILAAADGVVVRTGQDPGYGRFVELKHAEGLTTLYGHLAAFDPLVAPGAALKAGSAVGRTGSTGTSTGAHLHFEIHDAKDRPLNPELFLGRSFATAEDLPLKAALRAPRRVRVAYVSNIPKSKRALMAAREEADVAASAADSAMNATVTIGADGRPRATLGL